MTDLVLYAVQNREGKWFRSKGYGGYGETWVEDISKARVYGTPQPARARITYFANRWPEHGVPYLVALYVTEVKVLDETDRVNEARVVKQRQEIKRDVSSRSREHAQAVVALEVAQQRLKELGE